MRKPRWVLTSSITAGFALAVLCLLVAGASIYAAQVEMGATNAGINSSLVLLDESEVVFALLAEAESSQRGYTLTGADRFLKPHDDAVAALPGESATLHEHCIADPDAQRHLARLDVLIKARLDELRGQIDARRQQGSEAAPVVPEMDAGAKTMEEIRAIIEELRSDARSELAVRRALRDARRTRNRAGTAGAIGSGALLAGITLLALNRQTRRRMIAEDERDRSLRAEVALDERARAAEALRASEDKLRTLFVAAQRAVDAEREELLRAAKQARADAERAQGRAQRLVDANIMGVSVGRGDLIFEANDAFLRIIGYTRADLQAGPLPWRKMTPPEHLPLDDQALAELAQSGASTPYEKCYVRKDGSQVPILLGPATFGDPGSDEWVCFVIDLTDRNRTIAELRAARAQAEAANRAKDEFLAVLSHELRAPVHAIFGWLSILKIGLAQGRDVSRAIETVERNAGLQAQLVNDLLDVSRIVSGKLVLAEQPVELTAVVRTAMENAGPAAAAKGITLACEIGTLPMCVVIGDEARLFQVVGNLLNNAIKFTPGGGKISVTLASDAGDATIRVSDTGSGIAPQFLTHIFERFRQADATTTRAHGGLGIGLYLVKTLVELHHGGVTVSSEGPGKGATFTLRFPLQTLAEVPPSARVALGEETSRQLAGTTVVLVDDESDCREALGLVLRSRGAEVYTCASADEARRLLDRVRPDVIVSDIGMPGENGYAFMRSLRARAQARIPAIALTGFASRQDAEEAMRAGFDEHLAKPVRTDVLVARLQELVGRAGLSSTRGHAAGRGEPQVEAEAEGAAE